MQKFTITLADAFNGLTTIVEQNPERVGTRDGVPQSGCSYAVIEDGRLVPSCIVGEFFARIGLLGLLVTAPQTLVGSFGSADTPDQHGACNFSMWDDLASFGITVTDDAALLFSKVQQSQDSGKTWRLAFALGTEDFHNEKVEGLDSYDLVGRAQRISQELSPAPEPEDSVSVWQ